MTILRNLVALLAVAACASAQNPPGTPTLQPPEARSKAPVVSVLFSATDANGVALREVKKDQVTVFENEHAGEVLDVRTASDLPLDLAIVLLSSKQFYEQEKAAAIQLAQRLLRPGIDRAFVISARGDKPWPSPRVNWLTDLAAVAQAVRSLDYNSGLPDAFTYQVVTDSAHLDRMTYQPIAAPPSFTFFNVIWAMMKTDPRPVRRAAVLFRLAMPHAPGWGKRSTQMSDDIHKQVITLGQEMGIAFYTIGVEDPRPELQTAQTNVGTSYTPTFAGQGAAMRAYDEDLSKWKENQYYAGRANVDLLANETGGRSYWTQKKNYTDAVDGIANELQGRYVVTFTPPDIPGKGLIRSLKVQVARAAHVSATHAYVTPETKAN